MIIAVSTGSMALGMELTEQEIRERQATADKHPFTHTKHQKELKKEIHIPFTVKIGVGTSVALLVGYLGYRIGKYIYTKIEQHQKRVTMQVSAQLFPPSLIAAA